MVSNWKIKTLYYGMSRAKRGFLANGLDVDVMTEGPYLGFLLQNGAENVLIDTGVNQRFLSPDKAFDGNYSVGGETFVLDALAKAGLEPKDITTVIYTHLHNDHAGNCLLFPHAKTIAQRDEYSNLLNPLPSQMVRRDYDIDVIAEIQQLEKLYLVDGDIELSNGLRLYKTPGHSLGSQIIYVPTDDGPRLIVGDTPHVLWNLFPQMESTCNIDGSRTKITPAPKSWGRYLFHSLIYDHFAFYESLDKMMTLVPKPEPKYFLCGHDPQCLFDFPNE